MAGEKKSKTPKAVGKTPKAVGKTTKTAGKTTKTTGKTTGKTSVATAGKTASREKTPAKPASKISGKASVKTARKVPVKSQARTSTRHYASSTGKVESREKIPQHIMTKEEWDAFIIKMEQLLQEEKSEIISTLVASNNEFKEIVDGMDPKDLADIASDDIDRRMIEMLGSQELKRLKLIESAQTRIKQGKYGHCIKCDRPIPPERLEAIPYALMCIDCKSEEERRNR